MTFAFCSAGFAMPTLAEGTEKKTSWLCTRSWNINYSERYSCGLITVKMALSPRCYLNLPWSRGMNRAASKRFVLTSWMNPVFRDLLEL
jgi:hypothetical protein